MFSDETVNHFAFDFSTFPNFQPISFLVELVAKPKIQNRLY